MADVSVDERNVLYAIDTGAETHRAKVAKFSRHGSFDQQVDLPLRAPNMRDQVSDGNHRQTVFVSEFPTLLGAHHGTVIIDEFA
jgi:hypothetical protein